MLIYGDVSDSAEVAECLSRLRECAAAALEYGDTVSLDPLRALLIQAGQVEQAVEDEPECGEHLAASCRHLTNRAAAAFVNRWAAAGTDGLSIRSHLSEITRELEQLGAITSAELKRPVRLKVPEGFAFYGLYPAQYYAAAEHWMADRTPPRATDRHALVVGVRSIGTSLSAVVAATLKRCGWQATRLTVRPEGHPFKRHIHISPRQLCGPTEALVVDEGPGLSGSSMAAVARALAQAGLNSDRISFLPGHGGPPGVAASAESRYWWARTRRYFVPLEQLRRAGRTLMDALRFRTEQLLHDEVTRVEDLSAGQWRSALYADPPLWPPICRRFERRKYRCTARDGRSLLWKFAGLTPSPIASGGAARVTLAKRAAGGWTVAPAGAALGWIALPWVEGTPLDASAARDPCVLRHLARYIAAVAGPAMPRRQWGAAMQRLREMLCCNTREALGESMERQAQRCWDAASRQAGEVHPPPPTYGDGRMAPEKWLRLRDGPILKMDCEGHELDHTIIGRQAIAWDVAGVIIEFRLDPPQIEGLLAALRAAGAPEPGRHILWFHCAAYAAFRAGLCHVCANEENDPLDAERGRLWQAYEGYRGVLAQLLEHPR